nr:MAG TPA: hypothetical protein [Caudoviricetes sp.]
MYKVSHEISHVSSILIIAPRITPRGFTKL